MQSGKMDHRITIQSNTYTVDDYGGVIYAWSDRATVYQARGSTDGNPPPDNLPPVISTLNDDLKAENERLKAELAVASALAEERGKRLDQIVPLLTDQRKKRWWPF